MTQNAGVRNRAVIRSLWDSIPGITRFGLLAGAIGVVADSVHHVFTHDLHVGEALQIGLVGHLLTGVGMVFALWGVVSAARQSRRRAREKGGN